MPFTVVDLENASHNNGAISIKLISDGEPGALQEEYRNEVDGGQDTDNGTK
jgi:hypothetical protein